MSNTDKYLTMSKYAKADKETAEVNGMVEEERRSKSYAKIINQQSAASLVSRREEWQTIKQL